MNDTETPVLPLEGAVQHYPWGGYHFIPDLIGVSNLSQQPFAELWLGAHPSNPARVPLNGRHAGLDELIETSPQAFLGPAIARRFDGRLPFLFKILDVRKMLSIQAHPTKRQAEAGFARENAEGIPLDAPHRVFKDDNHKPEVMVALSDFWLLHGFRSPEAIARLPGQVPEWKPLHDRFAKGDLKALYRYVMELPQAEVNRLLAPMRERLRSKNSGLNKNHPDYWAWQAFEDYTSPEGAIDRGIFSIYLFNLVRLHPGQGIFQDAGIPHAYLEGVNVELMANSDNVFRGGLTQKHVDVPALMAHLDFRPVTPHILEGEALSPVLRRYPTPSPDFQLSRIELSAGERYQPADHRTPRIFIALEGGVAIAGNGSFTGGQSFLVKPAFDFALEARQAAILFEASVPVSD